MQGWRKREYVAMRFHHRFRNGLFSGTIKTVVQEPADRSSSGVDIGLFARATQAIGVRSSPAKTRVSQPVWGTNQSDSAGPSSLDCVGGLVISSRIWSARISRVTS